MRKRNILVAVAALAILGVVGCGGSDKSTAPTGDTVAPTAVQSLDGRVVQGSSSAIVLQWKSGPELDLAGYRIYRSVNGGTAELVGTTTNNSWNDGTVRKGAQYQYEVSAFDTSENEGARSATENMFVDDSARQHGNELNELDEVN